MNKIQQIRVNRIRKEYRNLLAITGDKEEIADALRNNRGQWEEAVEEIAIEHDFNRQDMEEVFGPYYF